MNVWTLKMVSIPIIATTNFLSGFLPYFLISRNIKINRQKAGDASPDSSFAVISPSMKRFLTLANFFSGGVFLSTCLIGLYPGVNTKFNKIMKSNPSVTHYPYAGLSLACGFFLVWFLEAVVHKIIHWHYHRERSHRGRHHHHGHDDHHHNDHRGLHDHGDHLEHGDHLDHGDKVELHDQTSESLDPADKSNNVSKASLTFMMSSLNHQRVESGDVLLSHCEEDLVKVVHDHEPHSHVPISGTLLGSVMLTFALGSHSIIEGLGFGVLDEVAVAINMLVTMVIHESVCAISLGFNIASKRTTLRAAIVLIVIFSILIPAGIGIGLVVDLGLQKNLVGDVTTAVLQGVAAGTFIYVVFIEILPGEMSDRKDPFLRLLMMAIGFAVIAGMKATHSHVDGSKSSNQSSFVRLVTSTHTH